MELRDLIVTPVIVLLIYAGGYFVRPYVTDAITRKYFFPALTLRILGAIALGFIYQFYYEGGDTYNYHTYGSRIVWEAFVDDPITGFQLIFGKAGSELGAYEYTSRIIFFRDPSSFFVVRIAAFFDLFTFSSYSATAVLFSVLGFGGMWMLFLVFYKLYPHLHFGVAIATLFIPSVFFWGSGLLKDTIIIGCLGIATYCFYSIFFERKFSVLLLLGLLVALYVIFSVKIFVLQAYLPAVIIWIMTSNFVSIRSWFAKAMLVPALVGIVVVSAYYAVVMIGENNPKYSVENLRKTAQITAYDIRFWTGRDAGSGYTIRIADWTPMGMLRAAPAAINVSLFRPYLWEVKNPLMLISAIESTILFLFSIYVLSRNFRYIFSALGNPNTLFCLIFSVTFAFAVGISTFNFGTLTRYKIPLLPFYFLALIILTDYSKSDKKVSRFDSTE